MKNCVKCKTENPDIAIFCKECGNRFEATSVAEVVEEQRETGIETNNSNKENLDLSTEKVSIEKEESNTELEDANLEKDNVETSIEHVIDKSADISSEEETNDKIETSAFEQEEKEEGEVPSPEKGSEGSGYIKIKTMSLIKGLIVAVVILLLIVIIGFFYIIGNREKKVVEPERKVVEEIQESEERKQELENKPEKTVVEEDVEISEVADEENDEKNEAMNCDEINDLIDNIRDISLDIKELVFDENSDRILDKENELVEYDESEGIEYHMYPCKLEGINSYDDYCNYIGKHFSGEALGDLTDGPRWFSGRDSIFYLGQVVQRDVINTSYDYDLYVLKDKEGKFTISAYPVGQDDAENFYTVNCYKQNGQWIFEDSLFVRTLGKDSELNVKKYYDDTTETLYSEEEKDPSKISNGIRVNANLVNIRKKPDTESESLGKAMKDECYNLISEADGWVKVQFEDQDGYIKLDFANKIVDGVCEETEVSVDDDEIICDLAKKYYKKMNGQTPPIASIDSRNGSELTIQLYEIMEYDDYPEENHASTWGWYYIDSSTLKGTDFFGMPVDLNEVR